MDENKELGPPGQPEEIEGPDCGAPSREAENSLGASPEANHQAVESALMDQDDPLRPDLAQDSSIEEAASGPHEEPVAQASVEAPSGETRPVVDVLIVDDEPYLAELVGDVLSRHGYQIACASSGEEALEYLGSQPVRLIISDHFLHTGELTGLEFIRLAQRHGTFPALMVTACIDEPILESLRTDPNVRALIRKPFDLMALKAKVDEALLPPSVDAAEEVAIPREDIWAEPSLDCFDGDVSIAPPAES